MIRRSITPETRSRKNWNGFQGQYHIITAIISKASNTRYTFAWLQWIMSSCWPSVMMLHWVTCVKKGKDYSNRKLLSSEKSTEASHYKSMFVSWTDIRLVSLTFIPWSLTCYNHYMHNPTLTLILTLKNSINHLFLGVERHIKQH